MGAYLRRTRGRSIADPQIAQEDEQVTPQRSHSQARVRTDHLVCELGDLSGAALRAIGTPQFDVVSRIGGSEVEHAACDRKVPKPVQREAAECDHGRIAGCRLPRKISAAATPFGRIAPVGDQRGAGQRAGVGRVGVNRREGHGREEQPDGDERRAERDADDTKAARF